MGRHGPSSGKNIEKSTARVTALDAVDFDSEIHRILKDQLFKIVHIISPSWGRWEPELDILINLIIWKLSVHDLGATFGQQLLSVRYDAGLTQRKAVLWAMLAFGVPYLYKRSPELSALLVPQQKDKVRDWLDSGETTVQVARMLNFLIFLRKGQFPDLVDRMLGVRPVAETSASRIVGYSYMTRELLWHGFIELIVFLLPLVNFPSLKLSLRRCLGIGGHKSSSREKLVYTTTTRCAVCLQPPVLPHQIGCGHAFCYYCLQSNRASDIKFECPSCGYPLQDLTATQPVTSQHCRTL